MTELGIGRKKDAMKTRYSKLTGSTAVTVEGNDLFYETFYVKNRNSFMKKNGTGDSRGHALCLLGHFRGSVREDYFRLLCASIPSLSNGTRQRFSCCILSQ